MKIAIEEFRNAVTACERISSGKSAPVFRMVLLAASDGQLHTEASDGDYWLSLTVQCEGDLEACLVPADKLLEAVSRLTADTLDVSATDKAIVIKGGRSKRTIQTEPIKGWINAPEVKADPIPMNADRLVQGFALCQPFAATDMATKGYLCGVRVHSDAGSLYFAATDGSGVVEYKAGETDNTLAVTAPTGLAVEAVKLGLSGDITMAIGTSKIALDWTGGRLIAPVVEGNFVDYRRIIPAETESTFTANADSIGQSVRGVSGFGTKDGNYGAPVAFEASDGEVTLTCRSPNGEAVDVLECEANTDVPRFGMSSAYMVKACKFFADGDMRFGLTGPDKPVKLTSEAHPDRVAVIMPRRI